MAGKSRLLGCSALRKLALGVTATSIATLGSGSSAFAQEAAQQPATTSPATVSPATAPQASLPAADEIVVTAEKRSTNLQRTPISMSALSGAALANAQIRNLSDIVSTVPSFQMGAAEGYQQITIRGIGATPTNPATDSTVSVNLNEVNIARPIAQATGLFDVSQLEVLRGPQGTLYGRNANAGSVNISTTMPTNTWSGYGKVVVGNYGDVDVEGAVGGALINDKLLVRVAGFVEQRNGYGRNETTGNDIDDRKAYGIRGTLVFKPTDDIKATVIVEHFREHDNSGALHYFGATGLSGLPGATGLPPTFEIFGGHPPTSKWDVDTGSDPHFQLQTTAVTGILQWSNGPFTLKSISGYRSQNSLVFTPQDGGSTNNFQSLYGEPARQFSEELQGHYDTSRFHGTVGLYYFHDHDDFKPSTVLFTGKVLNLFIPITPARDPDEVFLFAEIGGLYRTTAKAAFAQGTYDLGAGFSLTAGLRYSDERKSLDQTFQIFPDTPYTGFNPPPAVEQPKLHFTSTTPKVGIQYQATPSTMFYASYSKGFKSGGYAPGNPASIFSPEKITDYEGGVKTGLLGGKLRLSLDGFYYDYTNLQVQQLVGISIVTNNAAKAKVYGTEADFNARVTSALSFDGAATWLHARYGTYFGSDPSLPLATTNSDYAGKSLNNAPDFSGHIAAEYKWDLSRGRLVLRVEGEYSSKFFFEPNNALITGQSAFAKGNAFLTYTSEKGWHVGAYVRNIANTYTKTSGAIGLSLNGTLAQGSIAPPRTFGAEFGYRF